MKKLIVANWKMNPLTLREASVLFNFIKNWTKKNVDILNDCIIVICPPFVYLESLFKLLKNKNANLKIALGSQNVFWEERGAFTGEISPAMLKNVGCEYVIIGHSERRRILKESDEMINKKLKLAVKFKLKPILCIGETIEEKKEGKTFDVLRMQLMKAFYQFQISLIPHLIIAYEPVWAIGSGNACLPEEAKEILTFLRNVVNELTKSSTSKILYLYGGSVNSKNAKDYIDSGFDGLLVGGASLDKKEFVKIVKNSVKG